MFLSFALAIFRSRGSSWIIPGCPFEITYHQNLIRPMSMLLSDHKWSSQMNNCCRLGLNLNVYWTVTNVSMCAAPMKCKGKGPISFAVNCDSPAGERTCLRFWTRKFDQNPKSNRLAEQKLEWFNNNAMKHSASHARMNVPIGVHVTY